VHKRKTIGLSESRAALQEMLDYAKQAAGRPVAIAVTDDRGELVCFAAMAGVNAALARQNAYKKAYTSAVQRTDTKAFDERLRNAGRSVLDMGNPNFFGGGGGAVVKASDGTILGGLGVSGRTDDEDEDIVQVGSRVIAGLLADAP